MFNDILGKKEIKETKKNQSEDLDEKIINFLKIMESNLSFVVDKLENQSRDEFLKVIADIHNDRENFIEQCIHPIIDEIDEIREEINKL